MALFAETVTIGTSAEDVTCPITPDDKVVVINLGSDAVWIHLVAGETATLGGEDCQVCLPGLPVYLMWRPENLPYSMIADTNATDINIVNRLGR